RLERLPAERICEILAFFLRNPIAGSHTMRNEAADESRFRISGRLSQCRGSGNHRFQKRQCKRSACALQYCSPCDMFLGDKHVCCLPYFAARSFAGALLFIWNAGLLTMLITSDENL